MGKANLAESLSAWSTFATAVLTLILVVLAVAAWRNATETLRASREASEAAMRSAEAARLANEQAKIDGIEQTRPYVYVEVVPGLAGSHTWDIRIRNSGRSSARRLQLALNSWPSEGDEVVKAIKRMFETERTLPPGCSVRALWRAEGNFTDGSKELGLGKDYRVTVSYSSDDPSVPHYSDQFDVMLGDSGFTPIAESGPEPTGLSGDLRRFYVLGQALVRRLGELGR